MDELIRENARLRAEVERLRAAMQAYLDALDVFDADPMHAEEGSVLRLEAAMRDALRGKEEA